MDTCFAFKYKFRYSTPPDGDIVEKEYVVNLKYDPRNGYTLDLIVSQLMMEISSAFNELKIEREDVSNRWITYSSFDDELSISSTFDDNTDDNKNTQLWFTKASSKWLSMIANEPDVLIITTNYNTYSLQIRKYSLFL